MLQDITKGFRPTPGPLATFRSEISSKIYQNPIKIHQIPPNPPKSTQIFISPQNHDLFKKIMVLKNICSPKWVCSTRGSPPQVLNIIIMLINYVPRQNNIFCDRFDKIQPGGTRGELSGKCKVIEPPMNWLGSNYKQMVHFSEFRVGRSRGDIRPQKH